MPVVHAGHAGQISVRSSTTRLSLARLAFAVAFALVLTLAFVVGGCARKQVRPPLPTPLDDAHPFVAVDGEIIRALEENQQVPGLGLIVLDASGTVVFERTYADFSLDRNIALASASKWVSGVVLLSLVSDGTLSLDDDVAPLLSLPDDKRGITLRHLMSFTSGIPPRTGCVVSPVTTLERCVNTIATLDIVAAPGLRYDYGSTHLHLAGRLAELATGESWAALVDTRVMNPLGIDDDEVVYYAWPKPKSGVDNPLIAGGLRMSTHQYARFLSLVLARGVTADGTRIVEDALFTDMATEPFPDVEVGASPAKDLGFDMRYGLTSWLECENPGDGCAVSSSPGAYGFTPWIDRENGYAAILAMELSNADVETGIVHFGVSLEQTLQPLIVDALSTSN